MNNKAQFTPGPWVVEKGWNGDRPTITAKLSLTQMIDNRGLVADLEHTAFMEQAQVNATLIAAAPAMYAIIKDMREAFYVKGTRKALLEVMERSRDVLAQAEGRQA